LAILTSLVQQPAFPLKPMKSYANQFELAHPAAPSQNRTRQDHFASGRRRLIDPPSRILHAGALRQFHRLAVSAANPNVNAPRNANVVVRCAHHNLCGLNPVRTGIASNIETSDHTSVQARASALRNAPEKAHEPLRPIVGLRVLRLPILEAQYIQLVEYIGGQIRPDKRGAIAAS